MEHQKTKEKKRRTTYSLNVVRMFQPVWPLTFLSPQEYVSKFTTRIPFWKIPAMSCKCTTFLLQQMFMSLCICITPAPSFCFCYFVFGLISFCSFRLEMTFSFMILTNPLIPSNLVQELPPLRKGDVCLVHVSSLHLTDCDNISTFPYYIVMIPCIYPEIQGLFHICLEAW